jgi:hypothetical protein
VGNITAPPLASLAASSGAFNTNSELPARELDIGSDIEPDIGLDIEPGIESDVGLDIELEIGPNIYSYIGPGMGPPIN